MAVDFETLTDEDYFGEMKLLFATPGWEILCQELEDFAAQLNNVQDVKDQRDLDYKRGELAQIGRLLNFEEVILRAEEDSDPEE